MEWRKCDGYPDYQVSNTGLVKSSKAKHNGELMAQMLNRMGYKRLSLCNNGIKSGVLVHRLVALSFCDNPNNYKWDTLQNI